LRNYRYLRLNRWQITGKEITSQQRLTILYTGTEVNKNYLSHLAFSNEYEEHHLGKIWLWQSNRKTLPKGFEPALAITETARSFRKCFSQEGSIYIPSWVIGETEISNTNKGSFTFKQNKSLRSDVRKITDNNLQYRVSRNRPDILEFLGEMYMPYITKVHGDRAIIENIDDLKKRLRTFEVLFIEKDGVNVAGCLLRATRNKGYLLILGIKDGNLDFVHQGIIGAIYYFAAQYFAEKGYKIVHLGKSRSFLKDGVLNYKKKWGQEIIGLSDTGFNFRVLSFTEGVEAFLLNNPFIFSDNGKYKAAVFVERNQTLSESFVRKVFRENLIPGISEVVLFTMSDYIPEENGVIPAGLSGKITLSSIRSLFPHLYQR
jgi:hypothetical protein